MVDFFTIARRLTGIRMWSNKSFKGALEIYEVMTDLRSKSTCAEVLHYLRKDKSGFFKDCASRADSYEEFMDNVKHGTESYSTYYFDALTMYEILKLFNNKVMHKVFNEVYKKKATKRFRNSIHTDGNEK